MKTPFLSHLGVPVTQQALPPNSDSFPIRFNQYNSELWDKAIEDMSPTDNVGQAWGEVIRDYVELCVAEGVFPFSSPSSNVNDSIYTELSTARKALVHFFNRSKLLDNLTVRNTSREVTMTTTGFSLVVEASVLLKDPTIPNWLVIQPSPGFYKKNHVFEKTLASNCKIEVLNHSGQATMHWVLKYIVTVNIFPEVPGNEVPSKSELETFILKVLWMPVLRSLRPAGVHHKLV